MAKESALHEARRRFNEVRQRVRSDGNNWAEFLTCAARNHRYEFRDQLLIFDQRPYAKACADFDLWHDRFNRFIEKGTKSVRLLSPDGNSVKHVFDITDTRPGFGHEFDEPPYIWQVDPEKFAGRFSTVELILRGAEAAYLNYVLYFMPYKISCVKIR
jgi:hypothetical protein